MKKILAVLLALVMCASFCACGAKNITVTEVEEAFEARIGTLDIKTSAGDNVKSFTFKRKTVNVEKLTDKNYVREACAAYLHLDPKTTYGQAEVFMAITPLIELLCLLDDRFENVVFGDYDEIFLDIVCDGKSNKYNGWRVSIELNMDDDTVIYKASK